MAHVTTSCPVCERAWSHRKVLENESFAWLHCDICDHIWQWPAQIIAKYDSNYVADRYDKYDTTEAMSWLRLGVVKSLCCEKGRMLDVGYGNGSFIKAAMKGGFDAYGCDVHGCGEKYGVRERDMLDGKWDVVTFFDSLEHFKNFDRVKKISARYIVVSLPYRSNFTTPKLSWKHLRPGEHLHIPSSWSLEYMMRDMGLPYWKCLNVEDSIRGKLDGEQNILTAVFSYRSKSI